MVADPIDSIPSRQRLRIRLTRLGLHFLFVAIFAMAGGAIRGFNLLLVLAGFLTAILILHWRCSRRTMEILSASRFLPTEVFAGEVFSVGYRIQNHSQWLPAWMIRVDDELLRVSQTQIRSRWLHAGLDPHINNLRCGVGHVAAKQTRRATCQCIIERRGIYHVNNIQLSSSFPFALLRGTTTQADPQQLAVFPKLMTLRRRWQWHLAPQASGGSATSRRSSVNEGEFYGLRPWQRGDSPRQIHWRTTARIGDLAVRQTEESKHLDVCFLVDGYLNPAKRSQTETLETVASLAATLTVALSEDTEHRMSMIVAGREIGWTDRRSPQSIAIQSLRLLSLLNGDLSPDLSKAMQHAWQHTGGRPSLIVLSTRSLKDALSASDSGKSPSNVLLGDALAAWQRRSRVKWIDVSDEREATWFASTETTKRGVALEPSLLLSKNVIGTVA